MELLLLGGTIVCGCWRNSWCSLLVQEEVHLLLLLFMDEVEERSWLSWVVWPRGEEAASVVFVINTSWS